MEKMIRLVIPRTGKKTKKPKAKLNVDMAKLREMQAVLMVSVLNAVMATVSEQRLSNVLLSR